MECTGCEHKKGMSNRAFSGTRIPGQSGKCTRPGGFCGRPLLHMVEAGVLQAEILKAFKLKNAVALKVAYANALMEESKMKSSLTRSTEIVTPEVVDGAEGPAAGALTEAEHGQLQFLEKKIEENMQGYVEVGTALLTIRDRRLYRETHDTFEEYVTERFELARSRAYQLINGACVYRNVHSCGHAVLPWNENQARPLARLPEDQQPQAWGQAVEESGGRPTGKIVEAVVRQHLEKTRKPPKKKGPEPEPAADEKVKERAEALLDAIHRDGRLPDNLKQALARMVSRCEFACGQTYCDALRGHLEGMCELLRSS